jgi:NAD(P)-dependent dehydrogenase (short-subunit alcohol dehydrogenase family)
MVGVGRLAGKVAIVTGAARGMGAAHVRALAREGATVAATDIVDEFGASLAEELRSEGSIVDYHHHDVTSQASWEALVETVERAHGRIDVLVNNAGVQVRSIGIEADDREWDLVTSVNQHGVFLGMRATIPSMLKNDPPTRGSIVNIASVAALIGLPGSIPYQASKSAVLGLTRGAALSYGADNIRVNAICPGLVITSMTESASPDMVDAIKRQIPLGRDGRAEEIAAGVVFLASDESSFITGVALPIDGGMVVV